VTFISLNDKTLRDAFERIIALRQLTADTGTKTYKSQSAILESLDPQTLAAVALLLKNHAQGHENDQPKNPLK